MRRRHFHLTLVALLFTAAPFSAATMNEAHAVMTHRYSFTSNANDSVGTAHGTVVDPGVPTAVFTGGQLVLSANTGQGSNNITEDAFVDLPNGIISEASAAGVSGAFSLELWATMSAQHTWQRFADFGLSNAGENMSDSGTTRDYVYLAANSGRFNNGISTEVHAANQAGAATEVGQGGPLEPNVQVHVVGTYDQNDVSSGPNGTMRLYRDGVAIGAAAIPPNIVFNTFTNDNNWLGRSQWPDPVFDGSFNEFRIYDNALTAADVAADFTAGPGGEVVGLQVNKTNGNIQLKNLTSSPLQLDFYRISSAGNALSTAGWNSLDKQNISAVDGADAGSVAGDSPGEGWDQAGGANTSQLVELFLGASGSTLAGNASLNLGPAFNTSVFGAGNSGDLQLTFGLVGGLQSAGAVTYVTGGTPGDFDNNGRVDGNDFIFWQRNLGGTLNAGDLATWRQNYGSAVAAAGPIPEPAAIFLGATAVGCLVFSRRRRA